MDISRDLKKSLRTFADVIVRDSDAQPDFRIGPWIGIPNQLRSEAEAAGFDSNTALYFTRDEANVVNRTRRLMRNDPALEYLSAKETKELLEALAWRLTIEHTRDKQPATRQSIIREFIDQLEAPIQTYSILFPIDWLKVTAEPWSVGHAVVRQATQDDVETWFPTRKHHLLDEPPSVGATIAVAEAVAGSPALAASKAAILIDEALDLLRLSVAQFGFRVWDNQMRFRRQSRYFAKREGDTGSTFSSESFADRPHHLELQPAALHDFSRQNLEILQTPWNSTFPPGLASDVIRSMRWIGKSIAASDMDNKVIGLCTALECLLSDRSQGLKSNQIAWRSMTLGDLSEEGFTDPGTIIDLYDARSDVVHGSAFGICTEADYHILADAAIDVVFQIIKLIGHPPTITSTTKLFAKLDDSSLMSKCLEWCEATDAQGFKSLITSMKDRMEQQGHQ